MKQRIRLRFLADINPPTPGFEQLAATDEVSFLPLEAVWSDGRLDVSRSRPKAEVAGGYVRFTRGDVLCPKVTPTFQAGRSAMLDRLPTEFGAASTEVHVLRAKPERSHAGYIRYSLLTKRFLEEGVSRFQGVAGLQRVPDSFVRDFEVTNHPLEVQRRIAAFLDDQVARIDQAIALRKKQLELVDNGLLAVTFEEVTQQKQPDRQPSGLSWVATIPEGWSVVRLSLVATMGTGHTPSRDDPEYWQDLTIPWVSTVDIHSDPYRVAPLKTTELYISQLGLENSAAVLHPPGTVMLCRTASVGLATMVGVPAATSQRFVTWTPKSQLRSRYLLHLIRAMRPEWIRLANGATHGTVFFPDLEGIRIPLPPVDEQETIADGVERQIKEFRSIGGAIDRSAALLQERKRSLITAAVTGEFDVSSASARALDGVAS